MNLTGEYEHEIILHDNYFYACSHATRFFLFNFFDALLRLHTSFWR